MFLSTWRQWFHRRTGTIVTMFFLNLWLWKYTLTHILIKPLARHKNTLGHSFNTISGKIYKLILCARKFALHRKENFCPSSYLLFWFVEKLHICCKEGSFISFTYSILYHILKWGQLTTFIFQQCFGHMFFFSPIGTNEVSHEIKCVCITIRWQ